MSNKTQVLRWNDGCQAFQGGNINEAIEIWTTIADTSKIHFNLGIAYMSQLMFDDAVACFSRSIACDKYFALAYFQRASCYYQLEEYDLCFADLTLCLENMRGNSLIEYMQLGIDFKLHECIVHYNRALTLLVTGNDEYGLSTLHKAVQTIPTTAPCPDIEPRDLSFVEEALSFGEQAPFNAPIYQVPDILIFRPPAQKISNTEKVDYIGKAKLVATADCDDTYAGFSGTELKRKGSVVGVTDQTPSPSSNTSRNNKSSTENNLISPPPPSSAIMTLNRSNTLRKDSIGGGGSSSGGTIQRRPTLSEKTMDNIANNFDRKVSMSSSKSSASPTSPSSPSSKLRQQQIFGGGPSSSGEHVAASSRGVRNENTLSSTSVTSVAVTDKIKFKCHYHDIRIIQMPLNPTIEQIRERLLTKFQLDNDSISSESLRIQYKDDQGELVMITDDEDLSYALELNGVVWGQTGGKVELWLQVT